MKKLMALGILGLLCGSLFVFAEDAKVMPARMGRVYLAPSFSFANKAWDKDSEKQDSTDGKGAIKMFNLGFAVEYGIIDWITGAIQWAPGWNVWSDVDIAGSDANLKGVGDIFLGAKIQIIGTDAPVKNESFRLALGPGVKIPLPGPDFTEEAANAGANQSFTAGKIDRHTFGFGARTYFDYVINEMFSVNAYNEFIYYPLKVKAKKDSLDILRAGIAPDADVAYGFDLTFELEPHFDKSLGKGILFHAGLPVNYKFQPDIKVDGNKSDDTKTQALSLKPNASIFLTQLPLPLQFQFAYTVPLWGQNANATNSMVLQIRAYFKI
jgi:hypothetical protein